MANTGRTHFKKGQIPWNKGLSYTISKPKKMTIRICMNCGKEFTIETWRLKDKSRGKYCSQECSKKHRVDKNAANWQGKTTEKICKVCNTAFISIDTQRKYYCSKKCSDIDRPNFVKSGSENPKWKGGITPINEKIRKSLEYKRWRIKVFKRDNYTCQICGGRGGMSLRANHIKKFADYPELRLILNNGVTICKDCDIRWVLWREQDWESYFNFNLETRSVYE